MESEEQKIEAPEEENITSPSTADALSKEEKIDDILMADDHPRGISEKKFKILIVAIVISIVVLVLVWGMVPSKIYEISEVKADPANFDGVEFDLKGVVTQWTNASLNFTLVDSLDANLTYTVTHHGPLPEGFAEGATIVARGVFDASLSHFDSTELQVGCPSKY